MKRYFFVPIALCLLVSVILTSCGGGSGSNSGNTTPPDTAPTVTSVSPTTITAGSSALTLTVNGTGFLTTTTVQVGGVADATTYVSSTQVTATVTAQQLVSGAQLSVIALNGSASSGSGTPVNLQVTNPAPTISQLTPAVLSVGAALPVVLVAGTGFVPTTVINVNGSARVTTFVSATQVNVAVLPADVASTGTLSLTAVNPAPGGGTSAASNVAVNNPGPGTGNLSTRFVLNNVASPPAITVTGTNYVPTSTVLLNGVARATTYVSPTQISFQLTAADLAAAQQFSVAVQNPAPGGGTAASGALFILQPAPTPVITQVTPAQIVAGSGATTLYVYGSNLFEQVGTTSNYYVSSTILWNGTALTGSAFIAPGSNPYITMLVPANLLTTTGTATITVSSVTSTPAVSNSLTVNIVNPPPPTLTSISPSSGPIGMAATVTIYGTGFTAKSTVALNGTNIPATYVSSGQLTTVLPASSLAFPGNVNLTVTTPAPGGGTTAPLQFTTYIAIVHGDIVYNSTDGLLYASVPGSVTTGIGNSIIGIDPLTGNVLRQIFVGSNPNKLALSSDGTQLFVGLDGAGAVAQVNLPTAQVVSEYPVGGGLGNYSYPNTALYLAAVPGAPNSVAVASNGNYPFGSGITIYDSGVPRTKTSSSLGTGFGFGTGPLAFGSSASTLYMASSSSLYKMTVDSTGILAGSSIYSSTYNLSSIQYDNGRLYLSSGAVLDASTGVQLGTFYATASNAAIGPVVSDSTLGSAFVAYSGNFSGSSQVLAFNEGTFNPTGNIAVNGLNTNTYPYAINKILRWSQNGLALDTPTQIYVFESPLVKDLSSSPSDLSVSLTAPAAAPTGPAILYTATVQNLGPNQAQGISLSMILDASLIVNSVVPSQGNCGTGSAFACDLGALANGASATVLVSVTPSTAGTIKSIAGVDSISYDPTASNNQATANTTVSGSLYGAVPSVTAISPALVQAGSGTFTLTVTGNGFNSASIVNLNGTSLSTTYVSSTQLTASVDSSMIVNYGWAPVTVSNPAPGGGVSQIVPLTVYAIVNIAPNAILFDPYSQQIYATLPSASTSPSGNSLVAVNPFTGSVGSPVFIGSEPNVMAESADGNYLYIGLTGAKTLAQFNLPGQSLVQTFPLLDARYSPPTPFAATSLAVMPGTDTTLAVNNNGAVGIFDISGITGTMRPNFASNSSPTFPDASHLYTSNGNGFYRYSINSNGATLIDSTTVNGFGGFSSEFGLANGLAYGSSGGIINPSTTPLTQIASMTLPDFYQAGISPYGSGVIADASLNKDFVMMANAAGTWEYGLGRFDTTTYLPENALVMPAAANSVSSNWTMLRYGQDGLALLSTAQNYSTNQPIAVFILLRGPFVVPQLLSQSAAASLTSSSATSITHGASNTMLTLTGSNFLPGVAVTWNGSYRTTAIVDATHVTVAIPAIDLAAAGSGSLVATNPGATASSALTVTIN